MTELRTIRVGHEWSHIITDEKTGLFAAHGSYGTFAHTWPPQHRGEPLHAFLADLDMDYFMGKTRGRSAKEFDPEATRIRMKEWIIDARKVGSESKERTRAAWGALGEIEDTINGDLFLNFAHLDHDLYSLLGPDFYEAARHKFTSECQQFWAVIWPAFLAEIAEKVPA